MKDTPVHACTQTDTPNPRHIIAIRAVLCVVLSCGFLNAYIHDMHTCMHTCMHTYMHTYVCIGVAGARDTCSSKWFLYLHAYMHPRQRPRSLHSTHDTRTLYTLHTAAAFAQSFRESMRISAPIEANEPVDVQGGITPTRLRPAPP